MLERIQNTVSILLRIQFFLFGNFRFELFLNGIIFVQDRTKMLHPVMDHIFLHFIMKQMILCKNHMISECFQCFGDYRNRLFNGLSHFSDLGF